MELRRYWQIILRYWWLITLLTLVGVGAAYQYYSSNRPTYTNTLTINITRDPTPGDDYSGYYANISSEYAADDFTQVVIGSEFLKDVSDLLKNRQVNYSPDDLKSRIEIERKHREIYVTAHDTDEGRSLAINQGIADNLKANAGKYMAYIGGAQPIRANVVNMPTTAPLSGGRTLILAAVRPIVGLIVGLVLAFLLAYLDNSIRTAAEVKEVLGLPVLATIPKTRGRTVTSVASPALTRTGEPEQERVIKR
jgi:capsular polysaccharide biosynthesis protein